MSEYSDLSIETCEACRADAPTLTDDELARMLVDIPEWGVAEVKDVKRLRHAFDFDGWMPAVKFANDVAEIAEENDHHPLIRLEWGKVTVSWWTHKIGGLHRNDVIMAAKTSKIYEQQ